ncbi:MAG: helix-turn-helix transcriptional regulator [Peptoniphilus sp. oral taxon 375]|nr:helix-turn-helix transcriptional regulator [Peptoniphilus sp. oral taxon 375]
MYDYLNLVKKLKNSTLKNANDTLYRELSPYSEDLPSLQKYLDHLNVYLCTYFLLKYKLHLEKMAENFDQKIQEIETFEQAVALGEMILNDYKNRFGTVLISVDHQLIKQALTYIQQHFHEKITLDTVAKKLHLSKNYLCHLFQEETGHKFCEYVSLLRVQHAKKLIEEGKDSFTSISYTCGFSSQSHFSTTFKKYAGCTPKEYQKITQAK